MHFQSELKELNVSVNGLIEDLLTTPSKNISTESYDDKTVNRV